ncbi:MAG: histidinol-phosphate transaminase [Archaeoglobaceae archaeon]
MIIREAVTRIEGYKAGKTVEEVKREYNLQNIVKLASNENPYGPSTEAIKAFKSFSQLHMYPQSDPPDLKERIAQYLSVEVEKIVLGAGIDGILENVFKLVIGEGDEIINSIPSFLYYPILAAVSGGKEIRIPRSDDFSIDVEKVRESINRKTKLVMVCSPNNPTGNVEDLEDIRSIVESTNALIFIDEAYAEFSTKNMLSLSEYENVIIGRTFSKAFGLANLRLGYAVFPPQLKEYFYRVSTPFPFSTPASLAAMATLDDRQYLQTVVGKIVSERTRMAKKLKELGITVYPSESNFLFAELPVKASVLSEELLRKGVIIRDCSSIKGCNEYHARISVGKEDENDIFLHALEEVL